MVKKEWSIRTLDREELPGFQPYLLPDTARSLERREKDVLALGLILGHNACAAAAARLSGESAELTDLFVDEIVRHRGMGGLLLERLMERLAAEGGSRLSASYVLRGEELAAMDRLMVSCGFSAPWRRSRVFRTHSEGFHQDPRLGAAFSPQYRTPQDVCALSEAPQKAMEELRRGEDIPDYLAPEAFQGRALPELCVAMVQDGRVTAYLLSGEDGAGGIVLLAAVRREGAPSTAFQTLLLELLNRCWYRLGRDFAFYFSVLDDKVERLALLLMGERYEDYEEHSCARLLSCQDGGENEEVSS